MTPFATESGVPSLPVILAGFSLLVWIVLTFFRAAFWQLRTFDGDGAGEVRIANWPRVVAVVPARNESETMARCVESLVRQDYQGQFRILVVDDHSEDGTAALAQKAAESAGKADRIKILRAPELQPGWTGKLWALEQGVAAAVSFLPEYYWFTDADIVHSPDTLGKLVFQAEDRELELASLMVLLQAKTAPEKLLIPAFLYFFLMLYPPNRTSDRNAKTAGAAGGCILLRGTALERMGGLPAIRAQVIDDCALARAVKGSGGAISMGLTRQSVSLRVYRTFREIRDLIARTAFTQLKHSALLLFGTLAGMLLTFAAPVVFSFHTEPWISRASLAAWALMTVTYLPAVRFYRLSPLWALLLPVAAVFYGYATCLSAVRYWMGHGGQWKGRAQAPLKS